MLKRLSVLMLLPAAITLLLLENPCLWHRAHPLPVAQAAAAPAAVHPEAAAAHPEAAAAHRKAAAHSKRKKNFAMSDTTAPVPNTLSFSGTTGTITWTETQSQPVQNGGSSFTATGAGGSSDPSAPGNGIFKQAPSPYNAFENETQWYNGTYYIYNDGNGYLRMSTLPNKQAQQETVLYDADAFSNNAFPLSGWHTGFYEGVNLTGTAPAPTFTPNAGTVVFDGTQGLTITGLSGGAITVSNVVTSGTTTTFTISRTIASAETGGTFSGAASAFCDSAGPVNLTAAFTIPITGSMIGSPPPAPRNLRASLILF